MKLRTSELTGAALDWAVKLADAQGVHEPGPNYWLEMWLDPERRHNCASASTEWAQGGPIIEREKIMLSYYPSPSTPGWLPWAAQCYAHILRGPTPLIAAMRCYVASTLGDEVEIPEELA